MLWEGFGLWREHLEPEYGRDDDESGGAKPGEQMTEGDRDAFAEFVDEKESDSATE